MFGQYFTNQRGHTYTCLFFLSGRVCPPMVEFFPCKRINSVLVRRTKKCVFMHEYIRTLVSFSSFFWGVRRASVYHILVVMCTLLFSMVTSVYTAPSWSLYEPPRVGKWSQVSYGSKISCQAGGYARTVQSIIAVNGGGGAE